MNKPELTTIPSQKKTLAVLRVYGELADHFDYPMPMEPVSPKQKNSSTVARSNPKLESITLHHIIRRKHEYRRVSEYEDQFRRDPDNITLDDVREYKHLVMEAYKSEISKAHIIFCTCTNVAAEKFKNSVFWKQVIIKLSKSNAILLKPSYFIKSVV